MEQEPFSVELEKWLKSKDPKTIAGLDLVFAEKSFALAFLILLSIPALPLPTGGITHLFEAIAILLALELFIGRKTIWLPKRWRKTKLGPKTRDAVLPFLMRRVRWFEKFSRPRMSRLINHTWFRSLIGFVVVAFSTSAFLAPPFSGLDTLPALGVVILSLGLILEDMLIVVMGAIVGIVGIALTLTLGTVVTQFFINLF